MMTTLGHRFAARQTNGFDYLRVALAVAVIVWHCTTVSYGHAGDAFTYGTIWLPIVRSIMPVFFALSGFLVASSLERTPDLKVFLGFRGLRIFPALITEVLLSAFILGPLLTTRPLAEYFTGRTFLSYLANSVGWVHFFLPGVFEGNPDPGFVNRSLWTVPSELECYIVLSALFLIGVFARRVVLLGVVVVYLVIGTALADPIRDNPEVVVWARLLPLAFLAGVLVWKFRDRLPSGLGVAAIAYTATVALMLNAYTMPLACVTAGYAAAASGCIDVRRNRLLASGDYSYGMYLYAYPLQQLVVTIIGPGRSLAVFFYSMLLIPAFAVFSWHAIEKHALKLKSRIKSRPKPQTIPDHEPQESGQSPVS